MKIPKKYKDILKKNKEKNKISENPPEENKKLPKRSKRLKNFTVSAIKHAVKGMPTCTQEQIDERMSICQMCRYFTNSRCVKCGCACNNNKKFLNKLAWSDQECPIGKWGKIKKEKE